MTKNFVQLCVRKAAFVAALLLVMLTAAPSVFAQSAEIRSAGVYYLNTGANSDINDVYCNWGAEAIKTAGDGAYRGGIVNVAHHQTSDPWDTSALIEYDQPFPSPTAANSYPNHCLALCFDVYCTNKPNGATTYSISFPLQSVTFDIAKYYGSKGIDNADTNPGVRVIHQSILDNMIVGGSSLSSSDIVSLYQDVQTTYASCAAKGYYWKWANSGTAQSYCPTYAELSSHLSGSSLYNNWYYATSSAGTYNYAGHSGTTAALAEWRAYWAAAKALYDQTVVAGQDLTKYMCASYSCMGAQASFEDTTSCANPQYECVRRSDAINSGNSSLISGCSSTSTYCCRSLTNPSSTYSQGSSGVSGSSDICYASHTGSNYNGAETPCILRSLGTGRGYNEPIRFCTAWDGSYEILGEFGKTNGQFGFRANVHTDYPGDGIAIENITVDDNFVYPANNQYPIQVDVTNVHTVRTTPTIVGAITGVMASPYTIAYRLSKDADVKIQIFDASAAIPSTGAEGNSGGTTGQVTGATLSGEQSQLVLTNTAPVRNLVDWQPRLGEGMKGADNDGIIQESDAWDGRDDSGRLLPAGNYLVSIQAKSQDEWPGTDFSRAVTRQLSLDPLKLTDITVSGLNKQSTAYATINYVPTEASNVYFNIYSPGTTFTSTYTNGGTATGTPPEPQNGVLVYSSQQQRNRGLSYPDKWDGLCHMPDGCTITYPAGTKNPLTGETFTTSGNSITYANGAPLPDGDYVYVLWAEIPYQTNYTNAAGQTFTAVKTQQYYTGIIPVERGLVDITVQPVSYSTIGSSPTAYGLDPFIFKYSLAREAAVKAYVKNTAGVVVKTLTTGEGGNNTNVAQQMNTLTWDGRDDMGRIVGPGTYMFVVEAYDPMFPNAVKSQASALFPVDLYRITDVSTTDVYGDSEAKATISYMLSKAMNVQINIYNKDVVIPVQNSTDTTTTTLQDNLSEFWSAANPEQQAKLPSASGSTTANTSITAEYVKGDEANSSYYIYTTPTVAGGTYTYYRVRKNITAVNTAVATQTETYYVDDIEKISVNIGEWPPRVCDKATDADLFTAHAYVDPADMRTYANKCIYVNDTTFTNYPANPNAAKYNYAEGAKQTLDVRLQPIKTFNKSALNAGDGIRLTEEWDAQYFYNPTPVSIAAGGKNTPEAIADCTGAIDKTACPYEMVPDGTYPFYVAAQTQEPMDIYYDTTTAAPVRAIADVTPQTGLYATDKPVYRINITRGPVYFLDGSVAVYPNAPQLFNTSSGPVFVPPYEINFAISRAATVEVAVVALQNNLCTISSATKTDKGQAYSGQNWVYNKAGDVCKFLSTMTIQNTANFDPNITRRLYWDGTDNNGRYVRNGNYEIRLTAKNYPDEGLYQPTVKQYTLNVDLLKVFDLPDAEAYALNVRGTDMHVSYQISVPMKVAIQIFKPGTTIYDYQKGTLRDPATGEEVQDIRDVLVKSIVGIRPATTLIDEIWDGTDYAGQEVPDGTYPFRFVTTLNSADIDTITGEIVGNYASTDGQDEDQSLWKIQKVADTNQYVNLHHATVAIGDGKFVCEDWEKTVFFYPNPFKSSNGTMEITKLPVPGKMSIKLYNLAGDLVREQGYTCVDWQNNMFTLNGSMDVSPDNTPKGAQAMTTEQRAQYKSLRNAALRCFWDKKNDHGKRVARGVYFGLVDFRAKNGRQHCQKVVKILIPR